MTHTYCITRVLTGRIGPGSGTLVTPFILVVLFIFVVLVVAVVGLLVAVIGLLIAAVMVRVALIAVRVSAVVPGGTNTAYRLSEIFK